MKRTTNILLGASFALGLALAGAPSQAADLPSSEATAPAKAMDSRFADSSMYFQLLGGAALGNTVTYNDFPSGDPLEPDATKMGYAIAGTIGVAVMHGFSVEADVLNTHRDQDGGTSAYHSTSVMANLKYTLPVNNIFGLYAAAGLGYVWYGVTDPTGGNNPTSGAGYQFIAGANAKITRNISLVGEVRYQDTFNANYLPLAIVDERAPTTAVLGGIKVGF
jgi:opacity protein-like surface antigen